MRVKYVSFLIILCSLIELSDSTQRKGMTQPLEAPSNFCPSLTADSGLVSFPFLVQESR